MTSEPNLSPKSVPEASRALATALCFLFIWGLPITPCEADERGGNSRSVSAIVQEVRNGEELFRNLIFDYVEEAENHLSNEQLKFGDRYSKRRSSHTRYIQQGKCSYFTQDEEEDGALGHGWVKDRAVFNGSKLRAVQTVRLGGKDGGHARLATGEEPNLKIAMTPHKMGCSFALLSDLLTATGSVYRVEKERTIDGIRCVGISGEYHGPDPLGKQRGTKSVFWLAIDRHYIPVRTELYEFEWHATIPWGTIETSDWREIEPGVFVPFKSVMKGYWEKDLRQNKLTLANTYTFTVREASLRPNYDLSFFEDLEIPDGIMVYVAENGTAVESYVKGARTPTNLLFGGKRWQLWLSAIAGSAFLLLTLWLARRKWLQRKPASMVASAR
jgi:hypothetical protein